MLSFINKRVMLKSRKKGRREVEGAGEKRKGGGGREREYT